VGVGLGSSGVGGRVAGRAAVAGTATEERLSSTGDGLAGRGVGPGEPVQAAVTRMRIKPHKRPNQSRREAGPRE